MPDQGIPFASQTPQDATDTFDSDLRAHPESGNNAGMQGPHLEKNAPVAADMKEFVNQYPELSNDDLKQIVVLLPGTRLEQGAVYIDMREDTPQEFKARADMVAGDDNWYVPKSEVDYQLWNRLIGVQNPERTGDADDSSVAA